MDQSFLSSDTSRPTPSGLQQAFPIYDNQIRVVDLLPVNSPELVTFECRIIALDGRRNYEALSYVWEDLHAKRTVEISGYCVEVTWMLDTAFQHLRNPIEKRTLWTDQVCIDQTDDNEKSHQVRLMRRIYKYCAQCVVWLGDIPSDKGFSKLDAEVAVTFIHTMVYERVELGEDDRDIYTSLADDDSGGKARKAFETLIMGGNPWWSRVWTLQEASLPPKATLHWGPLSLSLETVELATKNLVWGWSCEIPSDTVRAKFEQLTGNFLYPVRGLSIARAGEPLLNVLMRWRYRKATDPRDKVYGFIGLLRLSIFPDSPALRDVSYGITSLTLFQRVTVGLIKRDKDLRVFIGARELPRITPGLPTRAIDFASSSAIEPSKDWICSSRRRKMRRLFLSGILVGCVQKVGGVYYVNGDEIDDERPRKTIVHSRCILEENQASSSRASYVGGGTLKEAFWRTILGNQFMGEMLKGPPKDYDAECFKDYVDKGMHSRLTMSLRGLNFVTTRGYLGIGSSDLRQGDAICVFGGGHVPFAIRSQNELPLDGPSQSLDGFTLFLMSMFTASCVEKPLSMTKPTCKL